jgi:hypothetical protein
VPAVVGQQRQPVVQACRSNQEIEVTKELPLPPELPSFPAEDLTDLFVNTQNRNIFKEGIKR